MPTNPLNTDLPIIHLKPGELYLSEKPEMVFTILGSCVTITMYNPRYKLAAMCHSLLPFNNKESKDPKESNFRYLDQAFPAMYNWFVRRGVKNHEIIVKVFGGGDVLQLERNDSTAKNKSIGTKNIDTAMQLILEKGLKIAALDAGGELGRKVFFNTNTGEVLLKRIKKTEIPAADLLAWLPKK